MYQRTELLNMTKSEMGKRPSNCLMFVKMTWRASESNHQIIKSISHVRWFWDRTLWRFIQLDVSFCLLFVLDMGAPMLHTTINVPQLSLPLPPSKPNSKSAFCPRLIMFTHYELHFVGVFVHLCLFGSLVHFNSFSLTSISLLFVTFWRLFQAHLLYTILNIHSRTIIFSINLLLPRVFLSFTLFDYILHSFRYIFIVKMSEQQRIIAILFSAIS